MKADTTEIQQLSRWLLTGSRKFRVASSMFLNRAAFETRLLANEQINQSMTVRNKTFVKNSLRVQKVARGASLRDQVSYVGSIALGDSTGFAEQEGVKKDDRKKIITLAARGGNKRRVVPKRVRVSAAASMRKDTDYAGGNAHRRAVAMLSHIERINDRSPFIMLGHHSFRPGMYKLAGKGRTGNIRTLQIFGKSPSATARNPWLQTSKDKYLRNINTRAVWSSIVRRLLKPYKSK